MGELNTGEILAGQSEFEDIRGDLSSQEIRISPSAVMETYTTGEDLKRGLHDLTEDELLQDAREKVDAVFMPGDFVGEVVEEVETSAPIPPQIEAFVQKKLTKKEAIRRDLGLHLRGARPEDIDQLVTVDLKTFDSVYTDWKTDEGEKMSEEELRTRLSAMFKDRLEMLGGQWIRVLEKDERIMGCIVACPTSKAPDEFKSWEDTTDNGSLETTYDPEGKYLYVVSLSAMPEVSDDNGKFMLMANMIGRIIGGDYHAYFESRVPGIKRWMLGRCRQDKVQFGKLSIEQMNEYAQQYLTATVEIKGKEVPADPLLRDYASVGCSFLKIVPDAYKDKRSLNYGVVCQYDNPLPSIARRIPVARRAVGGAIGLVSHSSYLTQKVL